MSFVLSLPAARADQPAARPDKEEARVVVAKSTAPAGTLLRREAPGKPWSVVEPKADVSSLDLLLALPLSQASVESKDGGVRLLFWGNVPQISAFPILESAAVLHEPKGVDLDLSLQRGRVVLTNTKDKGAAKVRVRLPGTTWDLTLPEPGTEVALEMYGRWPRGVRFEPDPKEAPTLDLVLLVLKGNVALKAGFNEFGGMSAPPGAAYYHWDSVAGNDGAPHKLADLPEWTSRKLPETPEAKAAHAVLEQVAKEMPSKKPEAVMAGLPALADAEKDPLKAGVLRRAAVYGSASLDELGPVVDALGDKHADVRDAAVQALRAWIGRGPGQDRKLYDFLQADKKFSKGQSATVLDLLHSFGDDDLARPETYEALIAELKHTRPAIRELAAWHLYRLVPAGKDIPYDAAGPDEQRQEAYKAWKKLVPDGTVPQPKREK